MTTWNPRANDLFLKAWELASDAERVAFLDRECAGDAALRAEVDALLDASRRAGGFLEQPAVGPVETASHEPANPAMATTAALDPGAGAVLAGRYKLLEQ